MHMHGGSRRSTNGRQPGYSTYDEDELPQHDVRITNFDELCSAEDGQVPGDVEEKLASGFGLLEMFTHNCGTVSTLIIVSEAVVLQIFDPDIFGASEIRMSWASGLLTSVLFCAQISLMLHYGWSLTQDIADLSPVTMYRLVNGWVTAAMGFSFIYLVLFIADPLSFHVDGWVGEDAELSHTNKHPSHQLEGHVAGVIVGFLYFSLATLTSVGFGDIVCRGWRAQVLCSMEMLLGVIFSVVIFGWALHYFQSQIGTDVVAELREFHEHNLVRRVAHIIRYNIPGFEPLRKFIVHYLFMVVVFFQLGTLGILLLLDPELLEDPNPHESKAFLVLCILQGVLTLLLISVSLRIAFKMHDHVEIGLSFLVQSYLSVIVLFDGIYLLVFLANKDSFKLPFVSPEFLSLPGAMVKFLYFSCTAMTTTGFGDITPRLMVGRIAVTVHMIVSQVYHILILGLGTAIFISRQQEGITRTSARGMINSRSWRGRHVRFMTSHV